MNPTYQFLLSLAGILLAGQVISTLGRQTSLPRVTLLLLFGIAIGKEALDAIPPFFYEQFEVVAEMTLLMVGFLIGGKLTRDALNHEVNKILCISIGAAIVTAITVSSGLMWLGLSAELAIILGCIASATAPAATLDVVMESKSDSPFSRLLISIVALDDAWALMLFGVGTAIALSINGHANDASSILIAAKDIGGALILGMALGFPAAYLTGRVKPGEPILTEALGLVFLCGGLALLFEVSFLIASILMGAIVANFASHHEYPFHEIENIEWPFMVIFFVLAGASLEINMITELGMIGVTYIACRIIGKVLGAKIGGKISGARNKTGTWIGAAMLPQAGVAIGMALVASNTFPEHKQLLLSITISSTIFFELVGPVFTRMAINRANRV